MSYSKNHNVEKCRCELLNVTFHWEYKYTYTLLLLSIRLILPGLRKPRLISTDTDIIWTVDHYVFHGWNKKNMSSNYSMLLSKNDNVEIYRCKFLNDIFHSEYKYTYTVILLSISLILPGSRKPRLISTDTDVIWTVDYCVFHGWNQKNILSNYSMSLSKNWQHSKTSLYTSRMIYLIPNININELHFGSHSTKVGAGANHGLKTTLSWSRPYPCFTISYPNEDIP